MESAKGSSIMGRFLGKPDLESFPNAAKRGIKIYTNQQIHAVSGYESLYRLFWNRKAEELCRSTSFAKWSKTAMSGVIATEWTLKKTALLFNHATLLINQKAEGDKKRKQKADTVHQGSLSMLNEHKNLLRLDEKLRNLKRADNTTRDKKKKMQGIEDAMQAQMTELKKRQEALRKGLENMAKEKQATNTEIVKEMDVNTTQLDSSSIQELIDTIMPQDAKGPDEEADSEDEQDVILHSDGENGPSDPSEEHDNDNDESGPSDPSDPSEEHDNDNDESEDSNDEGEQSPKRKRAKVD